MDTQTIRISVELPYGTAVQVSGDATNERADNVGVSDSSVAIDAGPPAAELVAALGDPEPASTSAAAVDAPTGASSGDAIDAGSFAARLAMEMETEGPRHPFGNAGIGSLASALSPVLNRESRN